MRIALTGLGYHPAPDAPNGACMSAVRIPKGSRDRRKFPDQAIAHCAPGVSAGVVGPNIRRPVTAATHTPPASASGRSPPVPHHHRPDDGKMPRMNQVRPEPDVPRGTAADPAAGE